MTSPEELETGLAASSYVTDSMLCLILNESYERNFSALISQLFLLKIKNYSGETHEHIIPNLPVKEVQDDLAKSGFHLGVGYFRRHVDTMMGLIVSGGEQQTIFILTDLGDKELNGISRRSVELKEIVLRFNRMWENKGVSIKGLSLEIASFFKPDDVVKAGDYLIKHAVLSQIKEHGTVNVGAIIDYLDGEGVFGCSPKDVRETVGSLLDELLIETVRQPSAGSFRLTEFGVIEMNNLDPLEVTDHLELEKEKYIQYRLERVREIFGRGGVSDSLVERKNGGLALSPAGLKTVKTKFEDDIGRRIKEYDILRGIVSATYMNSILNSLGDLKEEKSGYERLSSILNRIRRKESEVVKKLGEKTVDDINNTIRRLKVLHRELKEYGLSIKTIEKEM